MEARGTMAPAIPGHDDQAHPVKHGEAVDRFLARRLRRPWAEVHRAIQQCRVRINGVTIKRYHQSIGGSDMVEVDGHLVCDGPDTSTLVCHKPAGWACSHQIEHAPLLYDLVPPDLRHPDLQTIGRLDRDTTGLLLLTIDGVLLQRVVAPKYHRAKRYRIAYRGILAHDAVEQVAAGLPIADDPRPCLPARLSLDAPGQATLELCEGRNHQVKRMIAALGARVTALHRDRIAGLDLPPDLVPGAMRPLSVNEFDRLGVVPVSSGYPVDAPGSRQPS